MITKASFAKHPIHPMLVPLPIGLWIFSLACDLIRLMEGDIIWSTVALYALAGGIIGAVIAALPGLIDLLDMSASKAKRIGIWHMAINLTLVAMYLVNFLWRRNAEPGAMGPLALSILAVLLLGVSGWLGGEMVYVHGVAVEPVEGKLLGGRSREGN